ncbi:6-cysteine protein P47 [Plasmodium brasilianum]|uniref:6-cysteine protein P47 n=1 Tax=Plasmodium brasilianum TaxID=5824 RepID=A0ACB9Y3X9_PLABR|nr:6-cysteine protein P47 [Plasmodium brasilianum]
MKLSILAAVTSLFFIREIVNEGIGMIEYVCDFHFNPLTSVNPSLKEGEDKFEQIGCTVNNPSLSDIVALICPKKKESRYSKVEIVPSTCFSTHLYSPYDSEKDAKDFKKLDVEKILTVNKTFDDFELRTLVIPYSYKKNKTIYCRCDNRETENGIGSNEKEKGKVGLVKIILNQKDENPRGVDITGSNEFSQDGVTGTDYNREIQIKENEVIHLKYTGFKNTYEDQCDNLMNIKFGFISEYFFSLRMPTVFLSPINCTLTFEKNSSTYKIVLKSEKTGTIDGCDFTKPKGEGMYLNGFNLNDITDEEICSVHIKSGKKNLAAGFRCPYKLTPTYCFRHVLYEKTINGEKKFETFLLDDVLETIDVEYYANLKLRAFVVGFPTRPEKNKVIRCICENAGKKGIMELTIDSASTSFVSLVLVLLVVAFLYLN